MLVLPPKPSLSQTLLAMCSVWGIFPGKHIQSSGVPKAGQREQSVLGAACDMVKEQQQQREGDGERNSCKEANSWAPVTVATTAGQVLLEAERKACSQWSVPAASRLCFSCSLRAKIYSICIIQQPQLHIQ